jgi:release factor glutamine methyltransferase
MGAAAAPVTIAQALREAQSRLAPHHDSARLDAEVLLASVIGKPRSHLYAWPEQALSETQSRRYGALVERRRHGEPVAYLTGGREFWSLGISVDAHTLIPRPETETLVRQALSRIPHGAGPLVADLGTGSGAVALAIARERPRCRILATDISHAALRVARRNAGTLGMRNIAFLQGDWCAALKGGCYDLVVSNPPYIAEDDPHLRRGDVRFEPRSALAAGPLGLDDLSAIALAAPGCLRPGGWLLMEHGSGQGPAVTALLRRLGYGEVADHRDPAGHARVAVARRASATVLRTGFRKRILLSAVTGLG